MNGSDHTAEKLLKLYHYYAPSLPAVRALTDKRREKVRARWREHPDPVWWAEVFAKAEVTPFLCGDGSRGWRADFDWFMRNEDNALRVREGSYDGEVNDGRAGHTKG